MKTGAVVKFAVSTASAVIAGLVIWLITSSNEDDGGPDASPPEEPRVHYQEISAREFSSEIVTRDGRMEPTTVYGYLDFDAGADSRSDADVMVSVPFFQDQESQVRALASELVQPDAFGDCPAVAGDADGSQSIRLVEGRTYCLRTNQGRVSKFTIPRILTSWGREATIRVQYDVETLARTPQP